VANDLLYWHIVLTRCPGWDQSMILVDGIYPQVF
jgi:hypothetical protein